MVGFELSGPLPRSIKKKDSSRHAAPLGSPRRYQRRGNAVKPEANRGRGRRAAPPSRGVARGCARDSKHDPAELHVLF